MATDCFNMENCGSNDAKREKEVMPMSTFLMVLGIMSNVARDPDNLLKKSDKELCEIRNKKPCDNEYILRNEGYTLWQLIALDILRSRHPLKFDNEKLREAVKLYKQDTIKAEEQYGPIVCWDVSSVTNMDRVFIDCESFNADISNWDVSSVTDMYGMFGRCETFNADLSNWDVSSVTDMYGMFYGCKSFNADISQWDVSSVTNMNGMFDACKSFNSDLSHWDVSSVIHMNFVFAGCKSFNSDLSEWDVSSVKHMLGMFSDCYMEKINKLPEWYKNK